MQGLDDNLEKAENALKRAKEKAENVEAAVAAVEAAEEPFQASKELIENDELTSYLGEVLEGFTESK